MRFFVPQFIDVEDKIFGPLTFKQFVYIAGGAGLCVTIYWLLPSIFAYPLIILVAGFSLALAFYKVNRKPFLFTVKAAVKFLTNSRLYVWKKQDKAGKEKERLKKKQQEVEQLIPTISKSNLQDMSWSLDVKKGTNRAVKKEDIEREHQLNH